MRLSKYRLALIVSCMMFALVSVHGATPRGLAAASNATEGKADDENDGGDKHKNTTVATKAGDSDGGDKKTHDGSETEGTDSDSSNKESEGADTDSGNEESDQKEKKEPGTDDADTDDTYADDDDAGNYTGTDDSLRGVKVNTTDAANTTLHNETSIVDSIDTEFLEKHPYLVAIGFLGAALLLCLHMFIQNLCQRRGYQEIPTSMVV